MLRAIESGKHLHCYHQLTFICLEDDCELYHYMLQWTSECISRLGIPQLPVN